MKRMLRLSTLKGQPEKKYRLDRVKNDADLYTNKAEGLDYKKHVRVYFGK